MHSLREHFKSLGYPNGGSLLFDYFGHFRVPRTLSVSLQHQMERCRRSHIIHLNLIEVGFDTLPAATRNRFRDRIDLAILRAREIYDQTDIGVARIKHAIIEDAFAGSYPDIGSDGEASDLCAAFSVSNNGIDVFMVLTYANSGGSSPKGGDCSDEKDTKDLGVVVPIDDGDAENTATAVSHEVGHYLGLGHVDDLSNLMSKPGNLRQLTGDQIDEIRCHCMVTILPDPAEV